MLKIYKASAGSGKTYRLTQEYLNLLFASERAYRHILAVTFTNKATEEMKQRILEELDKLARKVGDPRQPEAERLLVAILNDYTAFQVSTIDRFFQRVMRAFARELGQATNYNVELDQQRVLSEAIDEMMSGLEGQDELLQWLISLSVENIENGESWDATGKLKEMGRRLFSEEYKLKSREMDSLLRNKPSMEEFRRRLQDLVTRLGKKQEDEPDSLTDEENKDLVSARLLLPNIYTIALFSDIREHLLAYCRENNLVLLSETNDFLNRLIGQDDTPFVYEKIGTRIRHYMLDEFQDTSTMQWLNFRPLLKDSMDNGWDNLVVGDVKQCIYRWRNSDWQLLNHKLQETFWESPMKVVPMIDNWRSAEHIVTFNNTFFRRAADAVQQVYNKERGYDALSKLPDAQLIARIFSDVRQEVVPKHQGTGRVSLQFVDTRQLKDNTDWKQAVMQRLPVIIGDLLERGYRQRDITLLVRKNKEGAMLASALLDAGFRVVTEESLSLSASTAVLALISRLKSLYDQGNLPNDLSLYALCERLVRELPEEQRREQIFIRTFMDAVLEFSMGYSGGNVKELLTWWDEGGASLCVTAPEGEDALRIMTVHKAKGLDATVVILPFLDDPFSPKGRQQTYLWATPKREPFSYLPILPLLYKSELKNSWFAEEYWQERLYYLVDLLNVAYVAFTRAKQEMIICGAQPKIKKNGTYSVLSLSNLLYDHYSQDFPKDVPGPWKVLEIGCQPAQAIRPQEQEGGQERQPDEAMFRSVPIGDRLHLALKGADFFSEDSERTRGVVLHSILSRIQVENQLPDSIHQAVLDGDLAQDQTQPTFQYLQQALETVRERHWFDGTYTNYNELSILDADGELSCPDRVMVRGVDAIVLDYKFGHFQRSEYRDQVRRYMDKVAQMGWKVSGYLWYVSLGEIVKI